MLEAVAMGKGVEGGARDGIVNHDVVRMWEGPACKECMARIEVSR